MATFILVHGACHGGWCWEKVVPLLQQHGHTAVTPDMPGGGNDQTPAHKIDLPLYAKKVIDLIDAAPSKPVVVGHSMGGLVAARAVQPVRYRLYSDSQWNCRSASWKCRLLLTSSTKRESSRIFVQRRMVPVSGTS